MACIIAPNFETILAVQRGHDELMGGPPHSHHHNCIGVHLLTIGGLSWTLDRYRKPLPYHLRGNEAEI